MERSSASVDPPSFDVGVTPSYTHTNVLILTSPKAGSGVGREQLPKLVQLLQQQDIDVCTTSSINQLRQRTQDFQSHEDAMPVVVAAGGDGTLALVADNVPNCVPIVPMPLGTENLLAKYLGHDADANHVAGTIQHGSSRWIDAGRANGKLFLVMATCGFDAEVVRAMHLTRGGHISRFSYAGPIFRALRRYRFPKIHVRVAGNRNASGDDTSELDCCWAMTFNFPCYGGHLHIEADADGTDGLLDVITFEKGSIISGLCYLAGVVTRQHGRLRSVVRTRGATVELSSEGRVPYQLDGDYGGHLPLKIEILPSRVHLLVPAEK